MCGVRCTRSFNDGSLFMCGVRCTRSFNDGL